MRYLVGTVFGAALAMMSPQLASASCDSGGQPALTTASLYCDDNSQLSEWMDNVFGASAIPLLVDMARADYAKYLANGAFSSSSFSLSNAFIYDDPNTDPVSLKAYALYSCDHRDQ